MIKKLFSFAIILNLLMLIMISCGGSSPTPTTGWKFAYMSDDKDATADSGVNMTTVGRIAEDMQRQI